MMESHMNQKVIVNPSQINYDFMHQRIQQVMKALSRNGYKCIFISKNIELDGAVNRDEPERVLENLWVVPEGTDLSEYKNCILYVNFPPNIIFADLLDPEFIIFDSVDEPSGVFEFWNFMGAYYDALERADLVLASAETLYKTAQEYNDNVILVPNACDYEHFKEPKAKPVEFENLEGPIVTYCGAIATWVDKELIYEMVRKYPEYNFVFVGAFMNDVLIEETPNMHILGHRPYSDIPNYIHHSDVLIIPFREDDEVVESTHPVKLYEYFATGKPVVTTAMPETNIKGVYWSQGHPEFMENIEKALAEQDDDLKAYRKEKASENTWDARVEQILKKMGDWP